MKKDLTHFQHYSWGTVNNLVFISLVCWIFFTKLDFTENDLTLVRGISLVACLPTLIIWEVVQKFRGGNNKIIEQFRDVFYGFVSAIYLVYFIPLAFI